MDAFGLITEKTGPRHGDGGGGVNGFLEGYTKNWHSRLPP
jgi:hypothetical protein